MSIVALSPLGRHHPVLSDTPPSLVLTPMAATTGSSRNAEGGISSPPRRQITLSATTPARRLAPSAIFTPSPLKPIGQPMRTPAVDSTVEPTSPRENDDGLNASSASNASVMSFASPLKLRSRELGQHSEGSYGIGSAAQLTMEVSKVEEMFNTFRQDMIQHVNNVHLEMLRQFQRQRVRCLCCA